MPFKNIIHAKTNIFGTMAIAVIASASTLVLANWISPIVVHVSNKPTSSALMNPVAASSTLDCDQGVYSPVQRACVDQAVFNDEMKRLFAALGIDTSIYQQGEKNKE